MRHKHLLRPLAAAAAILLLTADPPGLVAARAQAADPLVEMARADGLVGEQADGYLGIVDRASTELQAHVDQINIKRRAAYTDLASKRGVTVSDVGGAAACELFRSRVAVGHKYRDASGQWRTRGPGEAVVMPGYCG